MNMATIIWDADQRELPGHGVVSKGDKVSIPEHMAASYVYQGLAVKDKQAKQEKSK